VSRRSRGIASLVGAGPGDPGLLTVLARRRLEAADLVLYDGLVPRAVVRLAAHAERVSVARRVGPKALTQEQVSASIIAGVRAGKRVVRLKAGDPFVFGRGGEEVEALRAAGVRFEVVPGLSTALAAPALAGIPVTYRGLSAAVLVISGHAPESYGPILTTLPPASVTLVVLMGLGERRRVARMLVGAGWKKTTPVAIVVNASQPAQRVWRGRLASLGGRDTITNREDPGVIVIGDVAGLM
jgi:uroporphyrin-III C-methyltransferase/precorrin-2 dehydrogenase/sirohydrochlorin ferrochelatase